MRMTSKASPSILASASSAELTASTSYPSRPKTRLSDSRRVVSSSTMSRRFVMMCVIGRRTVNIVPEPFVLLIVIVPPWSRTVP